MELNQLHLSLGIKSVYYLIDNLLNLKNPCLKTMKAFKNVSKHLHAIKRAVSVCKLGTCETRSKQEINEIGRAELSFSFVFKNFLFCVFS